MVIGSKRLKLQYDEPLSNFAFKFNLRGYTKAAIKTLGEDRARAAVLLAGAAAV